MPKNVTSKEEIIEGVIPVFAEHGYPNASIAMLAKACDLQKAHLYYYFENKITLMSEVLDSIIETTEETLFKPAFDTSISKHDRLQTFLNAFELLFSDAGHGKIVVNTILQTIGEETPFVEQAQFFYRRLIEVVGHLYEDRYSPVYAINKAEQAVQDLQGSIIMSQIFKDNSFFLAALKRVGKKI